MQHGQLWLSGAGTKKQFPLKRVCGLTFPIVGLSDVRKFLYLTYMTVGSHLKKLSMAPNSLLDTFSALLRTSVARRYVSLE